LYFITFEQTNKKKNIRILSLDVIKNTLENYRYTHESFQSMLINEEIKSLSLVFNMQVSPPLGKYFSYLEVCQKYISQIHEQFKVHIEGLQSNIPFIILEISFFLFFFPQGEGAYDGRMFLHYYVKYHIIMLFFPFISYKPNLLFVYNSHQSI
jgi:hypothetical protein